jgi:hypothetical protein
MSYAYGRFLTEKGIKPIKIGGGRDRSVQLIFEAFNSSMSHA